MKIGNEFIDTVLEAVDFKEELTTNSTARYILKAMMAGIVISFGYIVYIVMQAKFGTYDESVIGAFGFLIASSFFSLCLWTIYYSKSELLTSNMMMTSVAVYFKKITSKKAVNIMTICYIGNFLGGLVVALLLAFTTILSGDATTHVLSHVLEVKYAYFADGSVIDLFIRAIFCNFFINFAMLLIYSNAVKSDFGRALSVFFGVFIFMYLGLEHSVANTVFFTMSGFYQLISGTDIGFMFMPSALNVIVAILGNLVGGGLCIGIYYSFINSYKK